MNTVNPGRVGTALWLGPKGVAVKRSLTSWCAGERSRWKRDRI